MNYLEVKLNLDQQEEVDPSTFTSMVIDAQRSLGAPKEKKEFHSEKLLELGFEFNPTTKGYGKKEEFSLEKLEFLAKEISTLNGHTLTHGYIELKVYNNELYFWDKALIYEGVDTFKYCLNHYNTHQFCGLNVITKSDRINESLLNIIGYTQRYSTPSLDFITENFLWDKKLGVRVKSSSVKEDKEYILISEAHEL